MKKIFVTLILIYSFLLMGCPKGQGALHEASKAAYELSGLTRDAVAATGKAYGQNLISRDVKDRIANALKTVAAGGKRFTTLLETINAEPTGEQLSALNIIFSDEVTAPLLEILQSLKALTPGQAAFLRTAIDALRAAVLIISGAFTHAGLPVNNIGRIEAYV